MLNNNIIMTFLAFFAGLGVSAGTFAFILVIGVVPRILQRMKMNNVILAENVIMSGIIFGNIISLSENPWLYKIAGGLTGHIFIMVYGISTGMFVGSIAVALAEILHTFPILLGRFNITSGLKWIVFFMAMGKLAGAMFYFGFGYAT